MMRRYFQAVFYIVAIGLGLSACGKGGGYAGDIYPDAPVILPAVTGPNNFLTFPNQVLSASGVSDIDSEAYTNAYYAAVDPNNDRDTFAKWKTINGFDSGSGTQLTVIVGDSRDLGYGRHITARKNADGTMAFSVRNYLVPVVAGYGYSTMNLDAAIVQDDRWYIGASNIEFSPGPNGGVSFPKFYFYKPDGTRASAVNLDGRGTKWMPGPCITCHGGRGDPLTAPNALGVRLFPLVQNSASLTRGDVQAHMHPLEPDGFQYSTQAGFTRADQEAAIKLINTWMVQSYPLPFGTTTPTGFPEDVGRRVANQYEWQGTAASMVKAGYGGDGLPNATYVDATPADWASVGQSSLYQNVVVPSCRVCHILRGAGADNLTGADISLNSYAKFESYADQIKFHTFDRGNMPLAKIHYEKFWSTSSIFETLADFLQGKGFTVRDGSGVVLKPGRPIADAGPTRVVKQGATTLSGIASLFASSYQWSLISGPVGGATLSGTTSRDVTFTASIDGTYQVQLVVSDGATSSTPSTVNIVVNNGLITAPSALRFTTHIKPVLQTVCVPCHVTTDLATPTQAPIAYNDIDRNGDAVVDTIDNDWLYAEVRGRINFSDPADSALLLKPSGKHHGGNPITGTYQSNFDSSLPPGSAVRSNYDLFLNWILNGAPQ